MHTAQTADGRDYISQKLPFGQVVIVRVGQAGWKKTPQGLEDLGQDDVANVVEDRARSFWSLFSRPDTYQTQALDPEEIAGQKCDVVLLREGGLGEARLYLDPQTSLPVAMRYKGSSPMGGSAEIMETYGDWRAVGKVKMPYTVDTTLDGKAFSKGVVKSILVNTGVDPGLFGKPQ
jgi:hypothetical protein